ncbi:MAG: ABC transporter substrate-binding protein [Ilumatobacter sp.]|uniref:ABC transporter substrate-binding protein n=1 Tax=Ilumatobacter sp. TaxID=1967498 RepID=UPI00391D05C8
MKKYPLRRSVALLAGISLLAGACGSDEAPAATDAPAATQGPAVTEAPVATDAPEPDGPQRIVSLSPTHTEMLFAIGAGDLLVAVDEFSNYPAEALELPNELSGFEPNVEAIAGFEPDLVVIGGDFTGLGDQLAELGIESWDGPAATSFADVYAQIEQLGAVTGRVGEAAEVVLDMQTRIDAAIAAAPELATPLTYYHELDPSYFSADSTTFIGAVYSLLGLVNIADADESESFGFPQLNAEFLIDANPDLIFLADTKCCGETADTVAARPGFDAIAAVQNGNVIEMDDDIASRWGPRIADYLEAVAAAVQQAAVPA